MNTVFLRLDGPLQSWGVTSRFVIRDTADIPSKSGVLGLVCAAMGLRRAEANGKLKSFITLKMGVRVDRPGIKISDYHTAGAKLGMMSAEGKLKITQTTGEFETHVMRKEYLCDAAFLVALQGEAAVVSEVARALDDPVWPPFLGRKSCPPSVPVFDGTGDFPSLKPALESKPWQPRLDGIDRMPDPIRGFLECEGTAGRPVADIPVSLTHRIYGMRWVEAVDLKVAGGEASCEEPPRPDGRPATKYPGWKNRRKVRLEVDHRLCVFCKQPARDVHHISYANIGHESAEDLRSVCRLCHDSMTLLEYAGGYGTDRIDPLRPENRDAILAQRKSILEDRDQFRRTRAMKLDGEDD